MKPLFATLPNDLADGVRVTSMRNPVHYDMTYSALT
jgi:hypothetical protein